MNSSTDCDIGDVAILRELEVARIAFAAGEKLQLMYCVFLCARYQAVLPAWAADALLKIEAELANGRCADLNQAFGKPPEKVNRRAAKARLKSLLLPVIGALIKLRANGMSLSADDMSDQVTKALGKLGINVNARDVQTIYRTQGQFIKALPRGSNTGQIFGVLNFPRGRRSTRDVLKD